MLLGSQLGRIYFLDPQNKNQKLKYGEPEYNNEVIALYAHSLQKFTSASRNGKILTQDKENIFDQQEFNLETQIQVACFKSQNQVFYSNFNQQIFYRDTQNEKSQKLLDINTQKINDILYQDNQLGLSCKDLNFQIYDVNKQQLKWKAKNFQRDELNLRAPVNNQQSKVKDSLYYVLSGYDKVYVYDIRIQRKQIQELNCQLGEDFLTNKFDISQTNNLLAVSNVIGHVNIIDFRKPKFVQKRFKDHYGCITDIKLLVCQKGSLDRHVNITNLNELKLKKRIFLSVKLSKLLIQKLPEDINDEINEEAINSKEQIFQKTLENEEALWHNNVALPYQKKLKQINQNSSNLIQQLKQNEFEKIGILDINFSSTSII